MSATALSANLKHHFGRLKIAENQFWATLPSNSLTVDQALHLKADGVVKSGSSVLSLDLGLDSRDHLLLGGPRIFLHIKSTESSTPHYT